MRADDSTGSDHTQYPDSPPAELIEHPGLESEMSRAPDFGEQSYRGTGNLEGGKAIITGGDIGRAVNAVALGPIWLSAIGLQALAFAVDLPAFG